MDLGISGRTALVTGASRGLGLSSARALSNSGVKVCLVSRSTDRLLAAAQELPDDCHTIASDLSDSSSIQSMLKEVKEIFGVVDILVANAGGPPPGNFENTATEDFSEALQLNLLSTVEMCKGLIPEMTHRGWGRVVAITSIAVREPMAQLILSNTARSGLTSFLKTTATEVAGNGVTVNSIQPGLHATERLTELYEDLEGVAGNVPTGKLGNPDDFGEVVAFLCSEQAKFITGAAIPVDGGAAKGLQ
ncbi:MAG: SDR family oxidoreductase [Acidimicrobiales bacterium]|jgi:3-oxoacyl-[acyl-carrier protein] reductase|nr:SDR family oxidoreductase [Acidimicrobiales bacterium]